MPGGDFGWRPCLQRLGRSPCHVYSFARCSCPFLFPSFFSAREHRPENSRGSIVKQSPLSFAKVPLPSPPFIQTKDPSCVPHFRVRPRSIPFREIFSQTCRAYPSMSDPNSFSAPKVKHEGNRLSRFPFLFFFPFLTSGPPVILFGHC